MSVRSTVSVACATLTLAALTGPLAAQENIALPARDNPLNDRPATVFTIGAEEGESYEMFSGIRALAFDRTDNLYVLDGQNFRVLVFDARGKFLRQFGKKGGGPGELQAPLGLSVLSDGTIAVTDLANRGYVLYRPNGEYVRNVTFDDSFGMPLGRIEADPRGGIITRANARIMRPDGGGPPVPPTGPTYTKFIRQQLTAPAATANRAETPAPTALFQAEITPPKVTDQGQGRVAVMMMDPVFGARPTFGALPDGGIAVHHEPGYAVKLIDANGRHTRTLTRAIQPKKVTKKDQEEEIERRKAARASGTSPGTTVAVTMGGGGGGNNVSIGNAPAGPMQLNLDDLTFAEFMSVVTNVRTDPQGRVWVQRRHQDGTSQGPIDIVTSAGKYVGTLPPQALPDAVSASGLAGYIVRDDLGIERVSVRRLPTTWR